ncbi:quinone oxidoreductase [Luedemannella flava]|uniref:Quinone oxidoreductase n=1 Tax=Luedemannella flava TaxID=349316 RepID=A0ABP4YIJ9_9ACTN
MTDTMMRAIQIEAYGGPEVLVPADLPTPEPGPGEVLVRAAASGVNFVDIYHRTGAYPNPLPFVPGVEGAGTVVAVGPGVTDVAVGDRVGWCSGPGSYAEFVKLRADVVVVLPDGVSEELAAAGLLQGATAHYLTHASYPVRAGDTVLVHAAAGGTGQLVTQYAHALGARVIGTVSTDAKEATARAAGADEVLRYDDDVAKEVRRLTDGEGVPAVFDGVGRATFDVSLASLAPRGTLVTFGSASGVVAPLDIARLAAGSYFVTRPSLGHHLRTRAELVERLGDVLHRLADGALRVTVTRRFPLAEAAAAHEALASRGTTGKLLLIP